MAHGRQVDVTGWRVVCAIAAFLAPALAEADQWYVEPRASLQAFYDDNVRLSSSEPQSSFGAFADATISTGRRTEVSDIGIKANVSSRNYSDVSELDRTDGGLSFISGYQLGLSRFELNGSFDYDSTLTSEVETSGFVQVNKRRSRLFISPSWSYTLSPRASLDAVVSYEDVTYEDVELIPLYNYNFTRAGLTSIYALSERSQLFGRVSYDKYEASQVETESDSFGLEAGASYLISETLSVTAFAGLRHSKARTPTLFGVDETDSTGPLFELRLAKQFEVGQLDLSANRSLLPSSNGSLLDTTALAVAFDYPLSPRWGIGIKASAYRNRNPGGEITRDDRDYLSISPRLERRLTRSLRLDLSYRYRWQSYEVLSNDAVSNAVYLTLNYSFPREPLGRWSLLR